MQNPLDKAIEILGSQSAIAKGLGVTPQAVQQWEFIPERKALAMEELTDRKVTARSILEYAAWFQRKRAVA